MFCKLFEDFKTSNVGRILKVFLDRPNSTGLIITNEVIIKKTSDAKADKVTGIIKIAGINHRGPFEVVSEYTNLKELKLHADWMVQVAGEMRKLATIMEGHKNG